MRTLIEGPGRMPWYTQLKPVFEALGDLAHARRWLITDLELNLYPAELPYDGQGRARLLDDDDLHRLVARDDPQFIWAVLTPLPASLAVDLDALPVSPCADGNPDLWNPDLPAQFPGAAYEIVCWDSTCTIVTSDLEELHRRLRAYFPEARPMRPPRA